MSQRFAAALLPTGHSGYGRQRRYCLNRSEQPVRRAGSVGNRVSQVFFVMTHRLHFDNSQVGLQRKRTGNL